MSTVRRQFWQGIEVIHDVVYFGDDIRERFDALGLKGWWMSYFAQRSAALGTPDAKTVTALFHGFAPPLVERALPDAWYLADRDEILAARLKLAVDHLTPAIDPAALETDVARLAKDLEAIVDGLDFAGRALAAAHANLPRPNDPLERLWWTATVLREYRGDSHVAILVAAGLDGAAANALAVADGRAPARSGQPRTNISGVAPGATNLGRSPRPGRQPGRRSRTPPTASHRPASTRRCRRARSPPKVPWSTWPVPSTPRARSPSPTRLRPSCRSGVQQLT